MRDDRNERLASDYREMLKIQNRPYLSWVAIKGDLPCAEEYLLTVRIRTYALSAIGNAYTVGAISRCIIKVSLWDSYPYVAPNIRMLSIPPVFHPDWYSKGTYSPSLRWRPDQTLKDYILRMFDALRYEPSLISTAAPANYKALDWFMRRKDDRSLFPSDTIELTENTDEELLIADKDMSFDEIVDSWGIG